MAITDEELDQLPRMLSWDKRLLYQWEGFWYPDVVIKGMLTIQSQFEARSDDVILASSVKTGTTWLKALSSCIMEAKNTDGEDDKDELLVKNPHARVKTLEYDKDVDLTSTFPSPRLFHTHLPYNALPDSIKKSDCKIVYIARNPMDTFVSYWHFFNKIWRTNHQEPAYPLEKAYDEYFCKGVHVYGPFFDHVLQYWLESLKKPQKILFLKYEELKRDPRGEVKRLASFLGRTFLNEDEVEKVVWRSSLDRLKNLEVNKNGVVFHSRAPNSSFFRLGVIGDWKNYLTDEMKQGLDEITRIKFEGSGLHFET
ncbi:hypothetical protein JRO89_XS14G0005800 [Xanthoceras sorbifolium]|uniref:Sulfotransferase n=1 Tax=Xanthoceras sorbifolium TaxID=99658 RepID=A0ABQ8H341_9ROSI|nr:hypothetical protein JRO89_XS14G0005800 [Xanthoceras sorbifolium]